MFCLPSRKTRLITRFLRLRLSSKRWLLRASLRICSWMCKACRLFRAGSGVEGSSCSARMGNRGITFCMIFVDWRIVLTALSFMQRRRLTMAFCISMWTGRLFRLCLTGAAPLIMMWPIPARLCWAFSVLLRGSSCCGWNWPGRMLPPMARGMYLVWIALCWNKFGIYFAGHGGGSQASCRHVFPSMRVITSAAVDIRANVDGVCTDDGGNCIDGGGNRRNHAAVWKFSGGRTEVFSGIGGSFLAFFLTFAVVNHNNLTG